MMNKFTRATLRVLSRGLKEPHDTMVRKLGSRLLTKTLTDFLYAMW